MPSAATCNAATDTDTAAASAAAFIDNVTVGRGPEET